MKRRLSIAVALLAALAMVMTMSVSVFASGMSRDDALKKALKNAGLKKSEVKLIEVDKDDGAYEVEFTQRSNGKEFDYEIGAGSGKILKKSVDYRYKRNSSHSKIGKTAARKKVAKFSGISYKIISIWIKHKCCLCSSHKTSIESDHIKCYATIFKSFVNTTEGH